MILDTCALLWLAGNDRDRISKKTWDKMDQSPVAGIISITGFEIGLKYQANKLKLPTTPDQWVKLAVEFHQLEVIPLNMEMCLLSSKLPPIHKDPCDRFIIAAAILRGMPVVTTDRRFAEYGITVFN
ncbi:type II toxin-antitoxin system VapC family toxin [uncultured Desulfobacter sp.]|uniref:type II toxin-antitoxin system VapC family toxin n=1 Tax=uncultured Desulfobacter sp. TaxID=240139 RepID=UPI002AA5E422|nr:type II toxin-antitoxin system VapC family toxin [uncultured Desulfobacter sp.]